MWELMCNPQGHCPYVTSTEFVWEDEFVNLRIHRIQESFIGKQPVHPEKINMEPEHDLFDKGNHLPKLNFLWGSMLVFRGVSRMIQLF